MLIILQINFLFFLKGKSKQGHVLIDVKIKIDKITIPAIPVLLLKL